MEDVLKNDCGWLVHQTVVHEGKKDFFKYKLERLQMTAFRQLELKVEVHLLIARLVAPPNHNNWPEKSFGK